MALSRKNGSTKKPTKTAEFVKLDDLPKYLKEKFDSYKLSPQSLDFCLRMAAGEDAMTIVSELYSYDGDRAQIKRQAKKLLGNPKLQDMITIFRQNLKHKAIVDANTLLSRLEIMYSECMFDDDKVMALEIIKQMSRIIKDNSGSITVTDLKIKFELPNSIKIKNKDDIQDAEVIE